MNITIKTVLLSTLIALIPTTQALGLFGTNPDIVPAGRLAIPVKKFGSIGLSTNPSRGINFTFNNAWIQTGVSIATLLLISAVLAYQYRFTKTHKPGTKKPEWLPSVNLGIDFAGKVDFPKS